jgi:Aspartyl protease
VQEEDGLDCHVKTPEGRDNVGSFWNRPSPTPSCQSNPRDWSPAGTNYSLPPVRKNGVTLPRLPHLPSGTSRSKTIKVENCRMEPVQQEETLDYHGQIVPRHARSAKAACRARRKRRQTIEKAKRHRKERQSLRATIKDDDLEPIYLSKLAQGRNQLNRRQLLGAKVKLNDHELVALIDSGCEVELVLSRYLVDKVGIDYSLIPREISLPDGPRMAAARSPTVSLDISGSRKELTAVVVDMAAFDCIIGLLARLYQPRHQLEG